MGDEGVLHGCLIECDAADKRSRRKRWRRALLAALAAEAAVVAGLLVWPLLTPGSPPREFVLMPNVPYSPAAPVKERPAARQTEHAARELPTQIVFEPPRIPAHIDASADQAANSAPPAISGLGDGAHGDWNGIPGATGSSPPLLAPPRPAVPPRRVIRSEPAQTGLLIFRVLPQYPEIARIARISGTVELRAVIGRDGSVLSVEVLSGNELLARAASDAVREWRYRPTILDGQAVEVETHVTVRFVLK